MHVPVFDSGLRRRALMPCYCLVGPFPIKGEGGIRLVLAVVRLESLLGMSIGRLVCLGVYVPVTGLGRVSTALWPRLGN